MMYVIAIKPEYKSKVLSFLSMYQRIYLLANVSLDVWVDSLCKTSQKTRRCCQEAKVTLGPRLHWENCFASSNSM